MVSATLQNSNVFANQVGVEMIVPLLIVLALLIVEAKMKMVNLLVNATMAKVSHSPTSLFVSTAKRVVWVPHANSNAIMATKFQTLLVALTTGRVCLDGLLSANAILASKVLRATMSAPMMVRAVVTRKVNGLAIIATSRSANFNAVRMVNANVKVSRTRQYVNVCIPQLQVQIVKP